MVPIYAITSYCELLDPDLTLPLGAVRSSYEGFVLYQFFSFMVTLLGGEAGTVLALGKPGAEPFRWPPPVSWWSDSFVLSSGTPSKQPSSSHDRSRAVGHYQTAQQPRLHGQPATTAAAVYGDSPANSDLGMDDPRYANARRWFRIIKVGILQFMLVKPLTAITTFVLAHFHRLHWSPFHVFEALTTPHAVLVFTDNVSICVSLYCLVCFCVALMRDLAPYRPVAKFICLKGILFASYWQYVALLLLDQLSSWTGTILLPAPPDTVQAWLICFEMVVAAWGHAIAFNYEELYLLAPDAPSARKPLLSGVRDAVSPRDVVHDLRLTFLPGDNQPPRNIGPDPESSRRLLDV